MMPTTASRPPMSSPSSPHPLASIVCADAFETLARLPPQSVDLVFADPPYFLSNDGTTCSGGKRVAVNKGEWDRAWLNDAAQGVYEFNRAWLTLCRTILKPTGSIVVSGSMHNIYAVGYALQSLKYRMLNEIVWEKPAPPPNLGCRTLTHSHETLLWASLGPKAKHYFAYATMKLDNGDKQLKDVWRINPPSAHEKRYGKHPTQKPEALLERLIKMACPRGGVVVDPFQGSGTTGVVAVRLGRRYVGIDNEWYDVPFKRLADEYKNAH